MKLKLKAIWRILVAKRYMVYSVDDAKLLRTSTTMMFSEVLAINRDTKNMLEITAKQEDALDEVKSLLTGVR